MVLDAKGNVNTNIEISEYAGHLKGNERSYVGKAVEISNVTMQSGSITYELTKDYSIKEYEVDGEHTNGLLICYNDGESTIPLETVYNEETNTLKAEIYAEGIYFVIDVVDWVDSLGIEPEFEEEASEPALMTCSDLNIADIKVKGQVDIVFIVDTTASMGSYISNVKANMTAFVDEIEAAGIVPSFALVEYRDITYDGSSSTKVKRDGDTTWFTSTEDFKK